MGRGGKADGCIGICGTHREIDTQQALEAEACVLGQLGSLLKHVSQVWEEAKGAQLYK